MMTNLRVLTDSRSSTSPVSRSAEETISASFLIQQRIPIAPDDPSLDEKSSGS